VNLDGEPASTYRGPYVTLVVQSHDDAVRVVARGEIDLSASAALGEVVQHVRRLLQGRTRPIVLDMSAVAFCDAAGIPFVADLAELAEKADTNFGIQDPQPPVRRLFDILGFEDHVAHA
jgi:anti-anti-sigma factor